MLAIVARLAIFARGPIDRESRMSRWKAAGIHLSINAVVALLAAALIYGVWYPRPYSQAAGAGTLVLLLLGVDLVLGPLLTLVVFKAGKKGLNFDLTAIAVMQACAFLYGLHVVAAARPAFIVGVIDRFVLVTANELDQADLDKATDPEFRSVPWTGPRLVGAQLPPDPKLRTDILFSGLAGKDLEKFPQYYVSYSAIAPTLLSHAVSLDAFESKHSNSATEINGWLQANPSHSAVDVLALPLLARKQSLTVLIQGSGGAILDVLAIDPW